MGIRGKVAAGLAVLVVVAGVAIAVERGIGPFPDREGCVADVDGHRVTLSTEQAENAAVIAAVATRRGLPARAVTIALATAYQESKIINLEYGDRDSVGIFQQRPSQGWGARDELMDPYYATNAFYDALVKIDGYQGMRITEAAQKVQISGFPEAYQQHATDARALASALTGNSPDGQFTCVVSGRPDSGSPDLDKAGLTDRASDVRADLEAAFGKQTLGGFAPGGVDSGHMQGSAHYEGRAIDVFVRPVNAANRKRGWAIAYYLVAQADRLDIEHVIFDDRIWTTGSWSGRGWRNYNPGNTSGKPAATVAILEHRDHVHVDVHE